MSALDLNNTDDAPTQNDDSLFDVDLIEVDDLLNSASRLLEEVYSIRPSTAIDSSALSPREDAMEQVQRFLSSIREREEEDDVVFVEARPGNALPASARTTAVVDLCTPNTADESTPDSRSTRRRRPGDIAPITFPDLNPSPRSSNNVSRVTRRQAKTEPVDDVLHVRNNPPPPPSPKRTNSRAQNAPTAVSPNSGVGMPPLTCAVCMESVLNRQPTSTSCGHIFCQTCIMQAIRLANKCPLCNTKLNRNKVHRVYF